MINLLPPEQKESNKYGRINIRLVRYVVIVLIVGLSVNGILLAGTFLINQSYSSSKESLEADQVKILELEATNEEAKSLSASIKTISSLLDQEVKFSSLLREIGSLLPKGVVLRDLQLSEDRSAPLSLEVNAKSPEAVGRFQLNLQESELFDGADITIVEKTDSTSEYPYSASVNAYFAGATQEEDE